MSLTFRRADATDWEALAGLLQSCDLTLDGARECVDEFVLAFRDGALVASAAVESCGDGFGLLRSVATAPPERGRGAGREVVGRALAQARDQGVVEVILLTPTASGFFARLGFGPIARAEAPEAVRRSAQFAQVQCLSAVVMRKRVDA